jgi:hypothetical protein
VANFTFGSSFTIRLSHFEGKEVFGSAKQPIDYPLGVDKDSHRLDSVNFFRPQVSIPTPEFCIVEDTTRNLILCNH